MGLYDDVLVPCPSCGKEVTFQAKGRAPDLDQFKFSDAPDDVLFDLQDDKEACGSCDAEIVIRVDVYAWAEVSKAGRGQG